MEDKFITGTINKSRRSVLLEALALFDDMEKLKAVAGKNALLDCTLFMLAKDDPSLMKKLDACIAVDELTQDIKHICKHREIQREFEKRIGG